AYRAGGRLRSVRAITGLLPSARTQRERLARAEALPWQRIADDLRAELQHHGFVPEQFAAFFDDLERPHDAILRFGDPALAPFAPLLARHVRERGGGVTVATYIELAPGVGLADIAARLRADLPDAPFVVAGRPLLEEALGRLLRRELVGFCAAAFALN